MAVVHVLSDGRALAVLRSGTLLECWSPDGTLLWSVPEPDASFHRIGGRLYVTPDEESAWTTIQVGSSDNPATLLCRHSLADGTRLAEQKVDFPVHLASRTDGAWVARDSREIYPGALWEPYDSVVLTPSGRRLAALPLGESDSSYDFQVRRSPHLLLLRGYGEEGTRTEHLEKWIVRVSPAGVERLFPFRWDDALGRLMRAGPAVYADDEAGPGLVHTCTDGGTTHLVRRAYPGGDVVWSHRFEEQVTGVDAHSGQVHAVTGIGGCELLTLRSADGSLISRSPVALDGHVYTPLGLSAGQQGALVIGTAEGRLLRASTRAPAPWTAMEP